MIHPPALLAPQWEATGGVRAACSLRGGGVSKAPFDSFNLGAHVGDEPDAVAENRRRLRSALSLPGDPLWLQQVHGTRVVDADAAATSIPEPADAAVTRQRGRVLAILVADCMPVLLSSRTGDCVAAAHAGWRGLAAGVLEATVAALGVAGRDLQAWLGPAIGPAHFEVGDEVRAACVVPDAGAAAAFVRNGRGRWQCDLEALARQRLTALGVTRIASAALCTYANPERCYSYRRDGRTGRMAALIWRV